ncbi:MAG: M3 family metallopeptidase [Simkaniaceae bacterium]|nr:MAG: M3 family metallopeptidase [Simkaniaceae bacterium]
MMIDTYQTPIYEELGNPLLHYKRLIPFDKIEPDHFFPAIQALIKEVLPQLEIIESIEDPSWDTVAIPLEEIEEKINRVVGPIRHLKLVKDSPRLREEWSHVEPFINQLDLRIKQSSPLFSAFKALQESAEWSIFSPAQKRAIELRLRNAKLTGIDLTEESLEALNTLIYRGSELQSQYVSNMRDATKNYSFIVMDKKQLEGVSSSVLKFTSESYNLTRNEDDPLSTPKSGPWKLTLSNPVYLSILRHCKNREMRELIFRAQFQKASSGASDNCKNIQEQLQIRKSRANLLGYNTFAELSLASKMAPNVETVNLFLEKLRDASWLTGREDLLEVQLFAAKAGFREPFMPWDFRYWSERLKEERYHLSEEEIKPYFQLPKVLRGLFDLCHKIFGITIVKPEIQPPIWDPHVTYYLIYDESGEQLSSFYLDPFSRPQSKRGGAWTDTCLNRTYVDGRLQLPIAYIVCNSTPPIGDAPPLLTFRELETLFHEFGHALQHMLTKVNIGTVSGTNGIEWDGIEMASKFMENWCYHKPTLRQITSHYQTEDPLPEVLMDKLISARTYNSGFDMLSQLKYSLCDISLHHDYDPFSALTPFDVWFETCLTTSHLPCLEEDRFLCSFHHIFGGNSYAAGYYSYKWAEVLSADAFQAFMEVQDDWHSLKTVGTKFKETFLELGGSRHPMEVFEMFRGRAPIIEPLLKQSGFKSN